MNNLWRLVALIPASLAFLAFIALLIAVPNHEYMAIQGYLLTIVLGLSLFAIMWLGVSGTHKEVGPRRAIGFMFSAWLLSPVLAAIPFVMVAPQAGFLRSYAEAMAQLTTTGGQVIALEGAHMSIVFWRAALQWMGGYASIVLALSVLAPLNLTGPGVHRSALLTTEKDGLSTRIGPLATKIALLYFFISVLFFLAFLAVGAAPFTAVIGTMGSISTGGAMPEGTVLGDIAGMKGAVIGAAAMLIGATSFALHWDALHRRASYLRDLETRGLLVMVLIGALLAWFTGTHFSAAILDSISLVTTTATPMLSGQGATFPLIVSMAIVLVGGAALSTAGGVKIIRFILLFRRSTNELFILSHPGAVQPVKFRGVTIKSEAFTGLWVYVLGYAGALGLVMVFLAAWGSDFTQAANAAVAVISNAGPSFVYGVDKAGDFSSFPVPSLMALSAAMALGRFEILAALAVFSPEFWGE